MQKVNLTDRKCATCRWWHGERDIIFFNKKPFKVECANSGDCLSKRARRAYSLSCPIWKQWERLVELF